MTASSYYPRKIRTVKTGGKTQRLLSVPKPIAELFNDNLFICTVEQGKIVFTPITQQADTNAA